LNIQCSRTRQANARDIVLSYRAGQGFGTRSERHGYPNKEYRMDWIGARQGIFPPKLSEKLRKDSARRRSGGVAHADKVTLSFK
jgi:hypothetical protein